MIYRILQKTIEAFRHFLDIRMGFIGAVSMALIVYIINIDHGLMPALLAAGRQAMYTFFFGALFVKMAENISIHKEDRFIAILMGGGIPALLTTLLTYCLHFFRGTPEPFHSSVPTLVLGMISFSTWSYLKHRTAYSQDIEDT